MRITSRGFVNRDQEVTFLFDSKPYKGFVGDTVASALLANDVNLVGRSLNTIGLGVFWASALKNLMLSFRFIKVER